MKTYKPFEWKLEKANGGYFNILHIQFPETARPTRQPILFRLRNNKINFILLNRGEIQQMVPLIGGTQDDINYIARIPKDKLLIAQHEPNYLNSSLLIAEFQDM